MGFPASFWAAGAVFATGFGVQKSGSAEAVSAIAFLVAYGELAIGLALVLGILVRTASVWGMIYMLTLLFASNYPGSHVPLWQYFGAALDHLVLALCFAAFALGNADQVLSLHSYLLRRRSNRQHS